MTPFTQLAGLYGPTDDRKRNLYQVAVDCDGLKWSEYVVCRNEDELGEFVVSRDLVSGKGNYSVKVTHLTDFGLDSLWISA